MAGTEAESEAPATIEEPEAIEAIAESEALTEVPELSIPSMESLELVPLAEEDLEELQVPDEEVEGIEELPADSRQPKVITAPEEAEEISFGDEVLFEEPEEAAPPQRGRSASAAEPRLAEEEPSFEQPAPAQETAAESDIAETWAEAEFYYQQGLFDEARKS